MCKPIDMLVMTFSPKKKKNKEIKTEKKKKSAIRFLNGLVFFLMIFD
jgi:hypothetical protein